MKKTLKGKLAFLLILAMAGVLLPAWTVPAEAAVETTISENTAYDGTYHISEDTTLDIAKGATYSADGFCFDGNYTLTVRGAGTLEAGDITTTSSAVVYSLAVKSGRVTTGDITCDYGSKIIIDGGSFDYNNIYPYPTFVLSDGSPVLYAYISVAGLHAVTDVTYSVDGGNTIESSTDENGKLCLWLTEGSHTIAVSDGTTNYSAWLSPDRYSWMNAKANPVAAAENLINDRSVAVTEPGNYVISGSGGTSNTIKVNGGVGSAENPVNITLRNVNIDVSSANDCAFSIGTGSYVNLTLSGDNTLKSGRYYAGLNVPEGSTLTMDEDTETADRDSLIAATGMTIYDEGGAGIGANMLDGVHGGNGGTVIIHGGKITAEASYGAGIGGAAGSHGSEGVCGSGGTVTVSGGVVSASSQYGAGIGGGGGDFYEGSGGTVTISGGTVTTSSEYAAGIGRGAGGNVDADPGTCVITGGSVKISNGSSYNHLEPAAMYCDNLTDKTPAYLTTITVGNAPVKSRDVTYTVDGGREIAASTDADGKLSLWLAEVSHTLAIFDGTENYSVSLAVSSAGTNEATANPAADTEYSVENGCVVISKGGNYVINGTGLSTENTITINDGIIGIINIKLSNVNIDASTTAGGCAFRMGYGSRVNLTLSGSNTLKSADCNAGLSVEDNSLLTIYEDSATAAIDSLTATGGYNGAGIGGGSGVSGHRCGNVTIYGGTVSAYGGTGGAGIGGGYGGHGPGGSGGNVTIYGGTVMASGSSDGYDTPADIGHGTGTDGNGGDGSVTISGGSVKADNMGPATVFYDAGQTPAYLTAIKVGADPVKSQDVTYSLNGGQKIISCSTDENGFLYLWLPESSSTIIDISAAGTAYEAAGAVTKAAGDNGRTALLIPQIITPPVASEIYPGSALSSSVLTCGKAAGVNGAVLKGTFTWTNPAMIVSSSGSYSVTFTPSDLNYKSTTAMAAVYMKTPSAPDENGSTNPDNTEIDVPKADGGATADSVTTAAISVTAKNGADGTAVATVTTDQINDALANAFREAASKGTDEQIVKINIGGASSATSVSATMPQMALSALAGRGADALTITAPIGSVSFDSAALGAISKNASDSVTVTIAQMDPSSLTGEVQAAIGKRPVYDLSVTSGGKVISNFGGKVTVSIPYKPADGEDASKIAVYYISNSKLVMVPNCAYNAATGMVTFTTSHFSTYVIGYNDVNFADVTGWCEDYVNFLAARDIIHGTGHATFSPDAQITRAQFVTILANLSGDDLSGYNKSAFSDVGMANWYFKAVQWAYEKGIAEGSDGKFNPNANISREQMAVMLYNYAECAGLDVSNAEGMAIREFNDYENISGWAMTPVQWAVNAGILSGRDGIIAPKDSATRAEAAKMTAVLLQDSLLRP